MLLLGVAGAVARYKKRLFDFKPLLYLSVAMIPAGVIATLAGWYVVEVGRQPWLVQGLVRTADVVSPLPAETVAFTLGLFVIVYTSLFFTYIYFIRKLVLKGPPSLDEVQASLMNPALEDNDDLPATLNPAQVDIGYGQELSEYLQSKDKQGKDKQPQDKGEK